MRILHDKCVCSDFESGAPAAMTYLGAITALHMLCAITSPKSELLTSSKRRHPIFISASS